MKAGVYGGSSALWHNAVIERLKKNVYVTLDCDFFDPSFIPSLGTPEPGGFGWDETIAFLRTLSQKRRIVGFDVNELAPVPQLHHPQFSIAKLIYKLIGYMFSFTG
jgi:agmatinase